jgi:glutamine synthetase
MAGQARGKIVPRHKYNPAVGLRLPEAVLTMTVTGDYPEKDFTSVADGDMVLLPDAHTLRHVPWAKEPTAQIIHNCQRFDGSDTPLSPRNVLRKVLKLYEAEGWKPVVAPEMEFYLVQVEPDEDIPLQAPHRAHPPHRGRHAELFHRLHQRIRRHLRHHVRLVRGPGHPAGHPDPRNGHRADGDQPRPRRPAAAGRPGVPVQAHGARGGHPPQHVRHLHGQAHAGPARQRHAHPPERGGPHDGQNIFSQPDGEPSEAFFHFIGGLQTYLPAATAFFAPYVNSYRRLALHLGADQPQLGLRQPHLRPARAAFGSAGAPRREPPGRGGREPYLAIAASLACGYLGMKQGIKPTEPTDRQRLRTTAPVAPAPGRCGRDADACTPLADLFGEHFIQTYSAIKEAEYREYFDVVSPWERRFLLLNV